MQPVDPLQPTDHLDPLATPPPKTQKEYIVTELIGWVKAIIVAFIITYVVQNFLIVNAMVPTGSMESTIMTNDRVIAFRLSYLFSDPARFDIVVFRNPNDPDLLYIKRIIGLPGETVSIQDGRVYINGEYLAQDSTFINENFVGNWGPKTVTEDAFFVLGDNRNRSEDSRMWEDPFVPSNYLVGRAAFKYFRGFEILR